MEIEYTKDGVKFGESFVTLKEIITNINKEKAKDNDLVLLTMELKGGRGFDGCLEEIVLPKDNAKRIVKIMSGKLIDFGEIAGKHSEIFCYFSKEHYKISSSNKKITDFLNNNNPSGHAYNHSFLHVFSDRASDGAYDDVDDDIVEEFNKLY
jgi:hypothetical protein